MLNEYVAEALGSFIFFTIVLTKSDPVMIAVGLLIGILISSIASNSDLNPAISTMNYLNGKIDGDKAVCYISAQLFGAFLAIQWTKYNTNISK